MIKMLQTRKINKDTVLVSYDIPEIMIRKSGKAHYGAEEDLVVIKNNKIIIHADTAKKYGLTVEVKNNEDDET